MTLVIIPARMNSTRLPGKPLAKIGDKTLIERCVGQAKKAGFEPWVATDSNEIAALFPEMAVMTDDCASGTDRVAKAAKAIDPSCRHKFVINYQGDMPFLNPEDLRRFIAIREKNEPDQLGNEVHVMTAFCRMDLVSADFQRTSFRSHIGLYGYVRQALDWFAYLPQSGMEKTASLEQLRSPGGFVWEFVEFPCMPIEINTQADLDRARACLM